MIIAHRGYRQHHKENTMAAFTAAFAAGADAVECDVRLTADNRAVVSHNDEVVLGGRSVVISRTPLEQILQWRGGGEERLPTVDELFDYIVKSGRIFFLELKSGAVALTAQLVGKIREHHLWEQVHLMGFWRRNRVALAAQTRYPRLRVMQILSLPLFSYIKAPPPSYGLFVGWLPAIKASRILFKGLISRAHLRKLRRFYEKRGFKVMAGLLNNGDGWDLFNRAGITDVVTDNVPAALEYKKSVSANVLG